MGDIIRMPGVTDEDLRKTHICSAYGKRFAWGPESSWYGDLDENICIKACSKECRDKLGEEPKGI